MNIQTSVFKLLKCLLNTFDTINKTIFLSKRNSFSDETKKKKKNATSSMAAKYYLSGLRSRDRLRANT